jgi:hypothetical protein
MIVPSHISSSGGRIWRAQLMLRRVFKYVTILNAVSVAVAVSFFILFSTPEPPYPDPPYPKSPYSEIIDFFAYPVFGVLFFVIGFDAVFVSISSFLLVLQILFEKNNSEKFWFSVSNVVFSFFSTLLCAIVVVCFSGAILTIFGIK